MDVRQQAVDEMMQRIKKGVQLRPVTQTSKGTRKQVLSVELAKNVTPMLTQLTQLTQCYHELSEINDYI